MATLTDNGIQIERLDDIIADLENKFRQIYGNDINLNPDTPDGQLIGMLAQMRADYEELAEGIYKQLDPDFASGAWLEQRAAYAGLKRKRADYSYLISAELLGKAGTKIQAGLIVSDGNKNRWVLEQDVTIANNGKATADFRSEQLGAFNVAQNEELTLETVVLGLDSAINRNEVNIGTEEETDSELRSRFFLSRHKNGTNAVASLKGALLELDGMQKASVLENSENTAVNGLKANSICVVVVGGVAADIGRTILEHKPVGIAMTGNLFATIRVGDNPTRAYYYRATAVDLAVSMTLVRNSDFQEIDRNAIKAIKKALSEQEFDIGEDVALSRLYSPINTVGGFWVKELKIGRKGSALKAENVATTFREYARILESDITIEVQ